jgi:hypothetical protein
LNTSAINQLSTNMALPLLIQKMNEINKDTKI